MKKYIFKKWLQTCTISSISTFCITHIIEINREIIFFCYMPYFTEIMCASLSLVLSLCYLTIFFNLNNEVRRNKSLNFFSFFLLPLICLLLITFLNQDVDIIYIFSIAVPYFALSGFNFFNYKKFIINEMLKKTAQNNNNFLV